MSVAQLVAMETGEETRLQDVDDAIAGALQFIRSQVSDPALQQLLFKAVAGLEAQLVSDKAMLPFVHLPLAVYAAIRGNDAPARPLVVATTMLFLGIDILDDIADGDLPSHWQGVAESEIQLAAATLLSSLPQLAISQLDVLPLTKSRMLACLSEGLLRMSGGQLHDLRGADKEDVCPDAVEESVAHKSGEEGALIAMLAAHMAGVSEDVAKKYGDFGRTLATGGQIATDCHDIFQAKRSKDLANGTRCLPIALYLSRLEDQDRKVFLNLLTQAQESPSTCELIRRDLRAKGILRLCAFIVEMYCQKAREILGELCIPATDRSNLERMVDYISFFSNKGAV
jgi:heptaprenyl diphosphate synthase